MEFNEKLQELRKQKGLTQEELAEHLFVSRTAISKWESGRGYPSIDSLKAVSKFFGVTVDELLSGDELLTIAEDEHKQKENHLRDLMFGLLDCSVIMFLFLNNTIRITFIYYRNYTVSEIRLFYCCNRNCIVGNFDSRFTELP